MADSLKGGHAKRRPNTPPPIPQATSEASKTRPQRDEFKRLFRANYVSVRRWLMALGISEAEHDDVTQETFVVALRLWDKRAPEAKFRAWLFSIARKVAANHRRSRERAIRRAQAFGHLENKSTEVDSPDDRIAKQEVAEFMNHFLMSLDEEMRLIFVMYEIDGVPAPEVAETLQLTTPRVHSRVRAARTLLQKQIRRRKAEEKRGSNV